MRFVCEENSCTSCMACIDVCTKGAISIQDTMQFSRAVIDESKCVDCNACMRVCHAHNPAIVEKPQIWKQGWAVDSNIRANSSSGGLATAIEQVFVLNGGCVCSCIFKDGKFAFSFADSVEEIKRFSGSKYVKSSPIGIYQKVRTRLRAGSKVLFVGLPCQVAAVKTFVGEKLADGLFTIDLICHGTPSQRMLQAFLSQYGIDLNDVDEISFRSKTRFQLENNQKVIAPYGVKDRYTLAFLHSLNYTENCYNCKYASLERVSDLTLGDSWGSELSEEEQAKGVSLVLVQTEKGKQLLNSAKLHLETVDFERAVACNGQLTHPAEKTIQREKFLAQLKMGVPFNRAVKKCLPKQCIKQDIKTVLFSLRKKRGGGILRIDD